MKFDKMTPDRWLWILLTIGALLWGGFTQAFQVRKIPKLEKRVKELSIDNFCSERLLDAMARKILAPKEYEDLINSIAAEKKKISEMYPNGG